MSLFRKPKKSGTQKTSQRRVFTDDDEEEDPIEIGPRYPPKDPKKKEKSVPVASSKQSLLSFGIEDEEGEVFQIKKTSHSKRVLRQFEKGRKKKEKAVGKEEVKTKEPVTEIVTDDLVVKVSYKPQAPAAPLILAGRDALCAGKDDLTSEDEEDEPALHRFSKPNHNVKTVLESGAIPDAAMIHAARKKRQRAREMGDFGPEGEDEMEETAGGRLCHEDDQDEASDEERIDMTVNHSIRDQERRREQFLAAQESDQDIVEWENQQIRKGVTGASVGNVEFMEYQGVVEPQTQSLPVVDPNAQQMPETIMEILQDSLKTLKMSRQKHEAEKQQILDDIIKAGDALEDFKKKAPAAAERFKFYQELRGYITDLVECLDEKVGFITDLELRALNLHASKAEWLVERRRQDVRDQTDELTNLAKGIRRQTEDEEKTRRAAEREGRKSRRRRMREQQGQPKHIEGMSSDDEIGPQEMLGFESQREEIETEIKDVLQDVLEDYSSVANILIRFEQWRETDPNSYIDAYATLCLPRVVGPLIRLNLIFWDPLAESVELEKLDWYRTLALYGLHDSETEVQLSKDPDINMLPVIVEKIIIPKLDKLIERCWDPLSSSQTLRLVGILSRYIRRFPTLGPASKSLVSLFNTILHKLKAALENDVFIPINLRVPEAKTFFHRQFASGLKLLRNITCWQGILNENLLKDLAIKALLNRYLLSAIKVCNVTDAVLKVGLISHILPRVWLQSNIKDLQMFSTCVTNLAQQLDKENPLHLESIETLSNVLKSLKS